MQQYEPSIDQAFLQKLKGVVLENLENEQFSVEDLADKMGISRSQLHRKLKKLKSKSVSGFIREVRLQEAMKLLQQDVATASEIAYRVGFSSPSYFFKCFQKHYGFPPGEVKKRITENTVSKESNQLISESDNPKPPGKRHRSTILLVVIILFTIPIAFFGFHYFKNQAGQKLEKSIAVLPFKSLSTDEENQHFTDGLVDDLLGRLALISDLEVTSRTSSETFRNQDNMKVQKIAAELGVSYIVEGSVQKNDDKVRIIVQLIDAVNDDHIWVKTFDRDLTDILKVQSEIAVQVASGLNMALSEEQVMNLQKNQTEKLKAMELYQLGRFHWGKRMKEEYENAIHYFELAIAEDPGYALAYAGIADTYYLKAMFEERIYRKTNRSKALEYANQALELDPQLAEAYTVIASVHSFFDFDWNTAEEEFKYGMMLNPSYSTLLHRYSEHLLNSGRYDESRIAIDKAVSLDPLSFIVRIVSAENYYDIGMFNEALEELKICLILNLDQFHWRTHDLLFATYCQLEKNDEVLKVYKLLEKNELNNNYNEHFVDSVYLASGKNGLIKRSIELTESPFFKALQFALLGDQESCIHWLEKSQADNSNCTLHSCYEFRILHDDPRYIVLLNQIGLPWKPGQSK